jgi:putative membrane protein
MYGYEHYGMGAWGWWWMILVWVIIIVAAIFIIKSIIGKGTGSRQHETPLDVLKRRYAAGEITKEQFDQMKKDITSG